MMVVADLDTTPTNKGVFPALMEDSWINEQAQ